MKAVWYKGFGRARDVLEHGDMPDPVPAPGEVLVQVKASGVNPSDVKLRAGARPGATMEFPTVIPHSDGAGEIADVGDGVPKTRIGERVWLWNAQWKRAQGSAAELIALPSEQAVRLPDNVSFAEGATFGIPAMTAWYAVCGAGPVAGKTALVTGGAGTVGRYACQMARLSGAQVITTVSSKEKAAHSTAKQCINYREEDVAGSVMDLTDGKGVDLIVDVDFGANQPTSLELIKPGGTIASYASAADITPTLAFYPFMFKNVTLRMLIVYLLPKAARLAGQAQLGRWLEAGELKHAVVPAGNLSDAAKAHEMVEAADKLGTVVLNV